MLTIIPIMDHGDGVVTDDLGAGAVVGEVVVVDGAEVAVVGEVVVWVEAVEWAVVDVEVVVDEDKHTYYYIMANNLTGGLVGFAVVAILLWLFLENCSVGFRCGEGYTDAIPASFPVAKVKDEKCCFCHKTIQGDVLICKSMVPGKHCEVQNGECVPTLF
jgi:hypothetical protein